MTSQAETTGNDTMINVIRLGHATLSTPDIERQIAHYTNVMGLSVLEKSRDHALLVTQQGLEAMAFERGDEGRLQRLAFQIAPGTDLKSVKTALSQKGVAAEMRDGVTPGIGSALTFRDPAGTAIDLFTDYAFHTPIQSFSGVMPLKLGHVARFVSDVRACVAFYNDLLGFRTSDWREGATYFLRCGPDHHTINVFQNDKPGLAHIAFEVTDSAAIHRACDILAANGCKLDWGPSRHNIGHNFACYHADPDGVRVEIYAEMDQMASEALGYFEPRPWHQDRPQRPKEWPRDTSKNYWGLWGQ